jgi:hypothetical protein
MLQANDIRFSKKRYDLYDNNAKTIAMEWLEQFNFKNITENIQESKKNFSEIWDVKGDHEKYGEFRIEAEIKNDWGIKWLEMPFKYDTMDIPYRKRDKTKVHATHHMIIGGDLNRLFIVKREKVLSAKVENKKVRNRNWAEEPFYRLSLPCEFSFFYFKNENNKWIPYKEKK